MNKIAKIILTIMGILSLIAGILFYPKDSLIAVMIILLGFSLIAMGTAKKRKKRRKRRRKSEV